MHTAPQLHSSPHASRAPNQLQGKWGKFVAECQRAFKDEKVDGQPVFRCIEQKPGELVWVPPGWPHMVINDEVSVASGRKGGRALGAVAEPPYTPGPFHQPGHVPRPCRPV